MLIFFFAMPFEVAQNSSEIQWDWPALWATLIKRGEIKTGNIRTITLREMGQKCNLAWTYDPVPLWSFLPDPLEIMAALYLNPEHNVRLLVTAIYQRNNQGLRLRETFPSEDPLASSSHHLRAEESLVHQHTSVLTHGNLELPFGLSGQESLSSVFLPVICQKMEGQAGQGCGP